MADIVEEALLHGDGQSYRLLAWCVMPNHVHMLIDTREGIPLHDVLHSWKSFTAKAINRPLGPTGTVWMRDYFDRYIRDDRHLAAMVAYIHANPVKAGLVDHGTNFGPGREEGERDTRGPIKDQWSAGVPPPTEPR
jgi:REP element-mobilizing transposase RayT